jgi:hypothetical protein
VIGEILGIGEDGFCDNVEGDEARLLVLLVVVDEPPVELFMTKFNCFAGISSANFSIILLLPSLVTSLPIFSMFEFKMII